jgi:Tol biopolymer transport system component
MPLQPGTKLGPYKILAQAGAGGMGEVYKAADTRLNRTVAIKVLPEHFSRDIEMKQRFEREAQTIAGLNHPHICTLYDVGHQDGAEFLVMEFLEGETLADRITRGPLPLDEALKVSIAVADALDKAHSTGVTHRDLKPGNVMLTASGAKLLDFGLAKLKQQSRSSNDPSPAPVSTDATTPGTILGTMQYMAPEQLEGREADARTDIFAFGAVLYEMVSGKRAFEGKSKAHLIAAIVSVDPEPLSTVQPMTPPALDYIVKRCLVKDPEERMQTAYDLLTQLRWIAEGGAETGMPAPATRGHGRLARLALAAAAFLAVVVVIPAVLNLANTKAPLQTRFLVATPDMPVPEAAAISPDGRSIAYSGRDAATTLLYVRPIDTETPVKLPGTEGAGSLFWSPDSRFIAFFAGGKLKKVQASGGPPQNICDTPDMRGGTWNAEDVILFASSKGLQRVKAVGGEPALVAIPKDAVPHNPYFLPDGQHFLYLSASTQPSGGAIYAGSLGSSDATPLVEAQSNAVYAEPGYLLYHREGTLYAHPFNPKKLALSGEAIRMADKLPYSASGAAAFSASRTGILIYRSNPLPPAQAGSGTAPAASVLNLPLVWVDRSGKKLDQLAAAAGWAGVDLSPNGKRVAAHRHDPDGGDVWIFEPGQTTPAKFTFDATQDNSAPVWTRDGTQVAFGSRRNGKWGIYIKLADNTRNEELLTESDVPLAPMTWSADGQTLVYWTSTAKSSGDIWGLPMSGANASPIGRSNPETKGEKKPFPILNSRADERHPQVSPDGKWIAYSSNETGRSEIYVQPYPQGTKIQVSVNGGVFPRWGAGGKELYFMSLISAGNLMVSNIRVTGASIQRDDPKALFQSGYFNSLHTGGQYQPYAASSDGQRFLVPQIDNPVGVFNGRGGNSGISAAGIVAGIAADRNAATSPASSPGAPINVVLNWTAGLREN